MELHQRLEQFRSKSGMKLSSYNNARFKIEDEEMMLINAKL